MSSDDPNTPRLPPLEGGLLTAMIAIDKQVRREMQRTPAQRDELGVDKWEPYQKRIERISSFVLNALGSNDVQIDSLLVLSQAMTKAMALVAEDLGLEGLGEVRAEYSRTAFEKIAEDARRSLRILRSNADLI